MTSDSFPYSTSPTTVRLVASTLIAAGAKVTVGDRCGGERFLGDVQRLNRASQGCAV